MHRFLYSTNSLEIVMVQKGQEVAVFIWISLLDKSSFESQLLLKLSSQPSVWLYAYLLVMKYNGQWYRKDRKTLQSNGIAGKVKK